MPDGKKGGGGVSVQSSEWNAGENKKPPKKDWRKITRPNRIVERVMSFRHGIYAAE
jgi:hypothetical protein